MFRLAFLAVFCFFAVLLAAPQAEGTVWEFNNSALKKVVKMNQDEKEFQEILEDIVDAEYIKDSYRRKQRKNPERGLKNLRNFRKKMDLNLKLKLKTLTKLVLIQ